MITPTTFETAEAKPNCAPVPGSDADKWQVHVLGPDDIHQQPDEITALRCANETNIFIARERLKDPNSRISIWCLAVVEKNGVEYHGGLIPKVDQQNDEPSESARQPKS